MAIKKLSPKELDFTGTNGADFITGNNLNNSIYGLGGNDIIFGLGGDDMIDAGTGNNAVNGGDGNDIISAESGNDVLFGDAGFDDISAGDGKNFVNGGAGDDSISAGSGNDTLLGGTGNDAISAGFGDDLIDGGDGDDTLLGDGSSAGDQTVRGDVYIIGNGDDIYFGAEGNDTFVINGNFDGYSLIDGGTSHKDNAGTEARYIQFSADEETGELTAYDTLTESVVAIDTLTLSTQTETDVRLNLVTRPGSASISTQASSIAGYNAVDTLEFKKSGDFVENLEFVNIERIELASGVNIKLSSEILTQNGEFLDRGFVNPGVQFFGVAGGPKESVTVEVQYDDVTFTQPNIIVGEGPLLDSEGQPLLDGEGNPVIGPLPYQATYAGGDFQLDDYTVASIFHDVQAIYDAQTNSSDDSYARIDGSNDNETIYGSNGVDNATMRLGDDTYYGNGGNDLIIGHGGADYLDGGTGDDIFVIGGFGSGTQGTTSKADDGAPEWIATGAKHDVIVGGDGNDTLRITTGIGADTKAHGTVLLNDTNLKGVETVQVGGTVGRLNVENAGLQLLNDHYYFKAASKVADTANAAGNNGGSIDNVVVDASGVSKKGLLFEGNANQQTFIGTEKNDTFIGNSGNDILTGGKGNDTFVFGKVYEQTVSGAADSIQSYVDTASNLTGIDTITDFARGKDHLQLNLDQFANLTGLTAGNLVVGAGAAAQDADDYLLFDSSSHVLSYDADGNGTGAAVAIVELIGVNTLNVADFVIA